MKKILLITLLFILQSIPSFGNSIDGKGIVCNSFRDRSFDRGFFFEESKIGKETKTDFCLRIFIANIVYKIL